MWASVSATCHHLTIHAQQFQHECRDGGAKCGGRKMEGREGYRLQAMCLLKKTQILNKAKA